MQLMKKLAKWALVPGLAAVAVASIVAISTRPSDDIEASSHREAPGIAGDPQADATDTYAFIAPDSPDKVTLVGNWIPLQEPAGGPNFYPWATDATYAFVIDNNGDSERDVTYEFEFYTKVQDPTTFLYATGPITSLNDSNFNIRQFYNVYRRENLGPRKLVAKDLAVPPDNIGPTSTPNYDTLANAAIYNLQGGGKVFAGQRDDPFFVDLGGVFDLATIRQLPGNAGNGIDNVAGFNTGSIVLQVPVKDVTRCKCDPPAGTAANSTTMNPVIGVWTDTYRARVSVFGEKGGQLRLGDRIKVSRLGNPLVNEVVIPLSKKDAFNASYPDDDAQFAQFVLNSDLAGKLNAVYAGIINPIPTTNRTDLVTVFLTGIPNLNQPANVKAAEELRLNVAIKPASCGPLLRLGAVAGDNCGFPNGRRLGDDVTDVAIRAVACGYGFALGPCPASNAPNSSLGDGVNQNDKAFTATFPYVASPFSGFASPHNTSPVPPIAAGIGGGMAMFLALAVGSVVVSRLRRRTVAEDAA